MANPGPASTGRRQYLQVAVALAAAMFAARLSRATGPAITGAGLAADFDPVGAVWLGYDGGHEAFTADLAEALAPFAPIKMLVRDAAAQAQARALLQRRKIKVDQVQFVLDARAPFWLRDAAAFGLDGDKRPFIVDFKWSYYGWNSWCRTLVNEPSRRAAECSRPDDQVAGDLDRRFADMNGWFSFQSNLAAEGGGVETNGRGLLIANSQLWRSRNPGMTRGAIDAELRRLPGIRKVIWVPHGLAHDPLHRGTITGSHVGWGTGGHTDEFVRFADPRTVLLAWVDDAEARSHPVAQLNLARMKANYNVLAASSDPDGNPLRVIKVPLPRTMERPVVLSPDADTAYSEQWSPASFPAAEGRRSGDTVQQVATSSYLNFVVVNKLVLLPDYLPYGTSPARQAEVRRTFETVFPGRRVQFIDAGRANWFGGGAHCATLCEPLGSSG